MADRAWISKTWMPETMKYQNCTAALNNCTGALTTLDVKLGGHDEEVKALNTNIVNVEKTRDFLFAFSIILDIAMGITILYINGVFDVLSKNKRRR